MDEIININKIKIDDYFLETCALHYKSQLTKEQLIYNLQYAIDCCGTQEEIHKVIKNIITCNELKGGNE